MIRLGAEILFHMDSVSLLYFEVNFVYLARKAGKMDKLRGIELSVKMVAGKVSSIFTVHCPGA
jgi:hypothetical protein